MITALFLVLSLQPGAIALQVQFVDAGWLPVPGITFYVQRVTSCSESVKPTDAKRVSATTAPREGTAIVSVQSDAYYRITYDGAGGFERVNKCVHLGYSVPQEPKAYVQVQIHVR